MTALLKDCYRRVTGLRGFRNMQRRAAEFFAGIGLMRMGLDMEGWKTVWANDLDEKKWEMYRDNFNEGDS